MVNDGERKTVWVDPPLIEKEIINLFSNTFKDPYIQSSDGCPSPTLY